MTGAATSTAWDACCTRCWRGSPRSPGRTRSGSSSSSARASGAAISHLTRSLELDPHLVWGHVELAWNLALRGNQRQAVEEARTAEQSLRASPGALGSQDFALASLAHVYALAGQPGEARRILAELQHAARQRYVEPFRLAVIFAALGDAGAAFDRLNQAFAVRSPQMVYLKPMANNFLARLHEDPRYGELIRAMRLDQP